MAPAAATKTYTQEEVDERVKRAEEATRRKQEAALSGFEIIAPIANPKHETWQLKNSEGKLTNPYKAEYASDFLGTFDLQIHPFITKEGKEYKTPQVIKMVNGKGFTQDEAIADWVKSYYGYDIKKKSASLAG